MNPIAVNRGSQMDPQLLSYYEAIERASAEMLSAARAGNWDEVVKLEGACVLLISQLKHAAQEPGDGTAPAARAAQCASSRKACAPGSTSRPAARWHATSTSSTPISPCA